jgi:cobalamin biosynthesis Co2+ chelatase CbiK
MGTNEMNNLLLLDDALDEALVDRFDQELERAFTSSKCFKSEHSQEDERVSTPDATMESFWDDMERKMNRT